MAGEERFLSPLEAYTYEPALRLGPFQSLIRHYQIADRCLTMLALGYDHLTHESHARDQLRTTAIPILCEALCGAYLELVSHKPTGREQTFLANPDNRAQAKSILEFLAQVAQNEPSAHHNVRAAYRFMALNLGFWMQSGLLENRDNPVGFFPEFYSVDYPEAPMLFNLARFHLYAPGDPIGVIDQLKRMRAFLEQATAEITPPNLIDLPNAQLTRACFTIGARQEEFITRFHRQRYRDQLSRKEFLVRTSPEDQARERRRMLARARWRAMHNKAQTNHSIQAS